MRVMKRVKKSSFATETARECSNYSTEMVREARSEFFRDSQPHRFFGGWLPSLYNKINIYLRCG